MINNLQYANVPLPLPENKVEGKEILNLIKMDLLHTDDFMSDATLKCQAARIAYGVKKYGVPLSVPNGRNFIVDLAQELSDGINYSRGAICTLDKRFLNQPIPISDIGRTNYLLANKQVDSRIDILFYIYIKSVEMLNMLFNNFEIPIDE